MCKNPREFNWQLIACHKCSECKQFRVDTIVGRCIAEQRTCLKTYMVTLTYGGDDRITGEVPLKARILDFRDVSLYLKRLRNFVKVRYVAAGEYGTSNQRAHWHLLIFTNGIIPNLQLGVRYKHRGPNDAMLWDDGFSHWVEATYGGIRYVCSYVLKSFDGQHRERRWGASRKPPIGREYFRLVANQHVEQGLSPQDCWYTFPEVRNKGDGKLRRFLLVRSAAKFYKQDFIDLWRARHGQDNWPQSEMLDDFLDEQAKELSFQPHDWLEKRRFLMKKADKKWDGSLGSSGTSVSVGMIAQREVVREARLDDRLRTMGNRKGQGYVPEGEVPSWNRPLGPSEMPEK